MKISTKGRYALRLLIDLAVFSNGEYIPLKVVSERQGISVKYLEQLITTLSKNGFVVSSRGAQGGYKLAKSPKEITVGDILRVMEGNLAPVSCLEHPDTHCPRADHCVTINVWRKIQVAVADVVDNITLDQLEEDYRAIESAPDYSI